MNMWYNNYSIFNNAMEVLSQIFIKLSHEIKFFRYISNGKTYQWAYYSKQPWQTEKRFV